jgi:hypothetical protein
VAQALGLRAPEQEEADGRQLPAQLRAPPLDGLGDLLVDLRLETSLRRARCVRPAFRSA